MPTHLTVRSMPTTKKLPGHHVSDDSASAGHIHHLAIYFCFHLFIPFTHLYLSFSSPIIFAPDIFLLLWTMIHAWDLSHRTLQELSN
ncbi:hypothetical protein BJX70DRAFT_378953 [Aspergillus crustosus]